jgi:formylglycine-generating enzyme required for sulfatase activity
LEPDFAAPWKINPRMDKFGSVRVYPGSSVFIRGSIPEQTVRTFRMLTVKAQSHFLARFAVATIALNIFLFSRAGTAEAPSPSPAAVNKTETIDLGGGVTMEFVLIPAGSFLMGSTPFAAGDADEMPEHKVMITQPFLLGKYEVTQEQWTQLMGNNPSHFKGAKRPVDTVSWNDCQRFFAKLHGKTGRTFSLPTEAQWEYACHAGTTTRWNTGDQPESLNDSAWSNQNSGNTTHPVGEKKPNAWGVYDLHGNLGEWCADWYGNPYPNGDATDPSGPPSGQSKVIRGGAWGDDPINVRSAYRNANGPDGAHDGIGFRCVMLPKN